MTGLEPATSGVTGQRSCHLNYIPMMVGVAGFEPATFRSRSGRSSRLSHTPMFVCPEMGHMSC